MSSKCPGRPRWELFRGASNTVVQEPRGNHIDRNALRHEELSITAGEHMHAKFGNMVWSGHDMGSDAITPGVTEVDHSRWQRKPLLTMGRASCVR